MEDDDIRKSREIIVFPQTLENLGIEELEAYISGLEKEIVRAGKTIAAKKDSRSSAESVFKK